MPEVVATELFSRFRISTLGGLTPCGGAPDGEVEDYVFVGTMNVLEIPTLSSIGAGLLVGLLLLLGVGALRRR